MEDKTTWRSVGPDNHMEAVGWKERIHQRGSVTEMEVLE